MVGSYDGHWQGNVDFKYNRATYNFIGTNAKFSQQEYQDLMEFTFAAIKNAGNEAKSADLSSNLLLWSFGNVKRSEFSTQFLRFTGEPSVIFDREIVTGK